MNAILEAHSTGKITLDAAFRLFALAKQTVEAGEIGPSAPDEFRTALGELTEAYKCLVQWVARLEADSTALKSAISASAPVEMDLSPPATHAVRGAKMASADLDDLSSVDGPHRAHAELGYVDDVRSEHPDQLGRAEDHLDDLEPAAESDGPTDVIVDGINLTKWAVGERDYRFPAVRDAILSHYGRRCRTPVAAIEILREKHVISLGQYKMALQHLRWRR
jgi:hypothetical protein